MAIRNKQKAVNWAGWGYWVMMLMVLGLGQIVVAQDQKAPEFWRWAPSPPMGWNSWDCFGASVTEAEMKANADYMAEHLKAYGWEYIVLDIQWYEPGSDGKNGRPYDYPRNPQTCLDEWGRVWPAANKHPSSVDGRGLRPLADYVHGLGLKFGLHMMRGIPRRAVEKNLPVKGTPYFAADIANRNSTCPWNPDMYGVDMSKPGAQAYYDSIFERMVEWQVDYVKIDDLSRPYHQAEIEAIRKAIDKTGRAIVFSTSPGETPLSAGPNVVRQANLWRISDDFWDSWEQLKSQFKRLHDWTPWRGTGYYPDADMLPLGNIHARDPKGWTHFTPTEQKTMMSLWAIARSPLMMGGHLPNNDAATLALLTHRGMLEVNQNAVDSRQLFRENDLIGWVARDGHSKDWFVALFNAQSANEPDPKRALWQSPLITRASQPRTVEADLKLNGARKLYLVVDDGGDGFSYDHADWLEPKLIGADGKPVKLTEMKWKNASVGWGSIHIDQSILGRQLQIQGKRWDGGIGTHAKSVIEYDLDRPYERFQFTAGLDDGGADQTGNNGATIRFMVFTQAPSAVKDKANITVRLADIDQKHRYRICDIWGDQDLGIFMDSFSAEIELHGSGLYRLTEVE